MWEISKDCVATRAEVESVGGLWHTPWFLSICPLKTRMYCICVRACVSAACARGGLPPMGLFGWAAVDFTQFQWSIITPWAKTLPRGEIHNKPMLKKMYCKKSNISLLFWCWQRVRWNKSKQRLSIVQSKSSLCQVKSILGGYVFLSDKIIK